MKANSCCFKAQYTFDDMIGRNSSLKETVEKAQFIAGSEENVFITGESGVGKELFAQSIHNASNPQGPFVALNCAAFPQGLIESELFGYESGAFTGALKTGMPGKIELANGGTLFLDEIGDMPIGTQAILLRVLQEKQVARIGSRNYREIDFRVIVATNQNVRELIKEKKFRSDLYFRLNVLPLQIPPLRERIGDLELFIHYFIDDYCKKLDIPAPAIESEALQYLLANQWPGNVRELHNVIIYMVNASRGKTIRVEHLPEDVVVGVLGFKDGVPTNRKPGMPRPNEIEFDEGETVGFADGAEAVEPLEKVEKKAILKAMNAFNHNVTLTAKALGISKTTLYRRLDYFGYDITVKKKKIEMCKIKMGERSSDLPYIR